MKHAKFAVALASVVFSNMVLAGEIKPYKQAEFEQLAAHGKPVVLAIYATWCTTCKAQKPIHTELMNLPAYKDVTLLTIDFDSEKPLLARYKASAQSTMIAFRGGKEVGRSIGDTSHEGIESLIKKTLN